MKNNTPKEIKSILIIDDDIDEYNLAVEAIKEIDPDISVSFLSSCKEIPKYSDQSFDIILLDINMPMHDGFVWLKGIKEKGYQIPVVMYTNSSFPNHITKAYEEGASLYFVKPDNFKSIIAGFKRLLLLNWLDPLVVKKEHQTKGGYTIFKFD